MPVKYKVDVLAALKAAGYSTYRIREEKLLAEATVQKIRIGRLVSWEQVGKLCALLGCQPGDLVEYTEEVAE